MNTERSIEATGEDVEEAIANGLAELGVGANDVIVEVLEEPSRGMFGLGSRPARVRLQLLITPPKAVTSPAAPSVMVDEDFADDEGDFEDDHDYSETDEAEETYYEDSLEEYDGPLDEDAEVGRVVLNELLEKMEIRAKVLVRRTLDQEGDDEQSPWLLEISGSGDLSALIGRRGETLASLQYITRLITSRELQRRANIVVDVGGYKSRRMNKLDGLAKRMAEQAVQQGRTITLEPMPPYERRIIHMALRDRTDVDTRSVGEGQDRKVTIVPK